MTLKISRSLVSTQPNPTHQKLKSSDPTQPNPTQLNPWMDPTHDQLCGTVEMRKCDHVTPSGGTLCVLVSFHRCDRCQCFPAVRCDCPRIIEIELIQQQGHGRILHRIGVVARDPQIEIQVVDRRG